MNATVHSLDTARTGRDLFNTDPLKYLLPALEKLDTLPAHALDAANIPEFFYERLVVAWREYRDWRDATNPVNWFTRQGSINPGAIHDWALAMDRTPYAAWLFMRGELENDPDTRKRLMQAWRVEAEPFQDLLTRAIADTDAFMQVFMKDLPYGDDIPF